MKKGVKGLENLNNTCYINSVIQLLSQVNPLKDFFISDAPSAIPGSLPEYFLYRIARTLQEIIKEIWRDNKHSICPQRLVHACWDLSPAFRPKTQQDSQEFLLILLDKLKEYHYYTDLIETTFKGTLKRQYTCTKCQAINETFEDFYTFPIDLIEENIIEPNDSFLTSSDRRQLKSIKENLKNNSFLKKIWMKKIVTLYDCLKYTGRVQFIDKKCSQCRRDTKHSVIEKVSQGSKYIFAYLKRFRLSMWNNKIKTHVYLPRKLDGIKFGHEGKEYQLIGVIEHTGYLLFGGHYEAYILNEEVWYHVNDDRVTKCSWNDVLEAQAYIFLYELIETNNIPNQFPFVNSRRIFVLPENPFRVQVISDSDDPELCDSNPNSSRSIPRKSSSFIVFNENPEDISDS